MNRTNTHTNLEADGMISIRIPTKIKTEFISKVRRSGKKIGFIAATLFESYIKSAMDEPGQVPERVE